MTHLTPLLLPQRINAVRSLEFDWYLENKLSIYTDIEDKKRFPNYEREWYMIWQTLASMSRIANPTRQARYRKSESKEVESTWVDCTTICGCSHNASGL